VDDAAITFAYASHLVEGYGLVLHPSHQQEEGYSSTLWLVILAAGRVLGLPIPWLAKTLGLLFGVVGIAIVLRALPRLVHRPDFAIPAAVIVSTPYVVWTTRGLEHGLPAALIALVTPAPAYFRRNATTVIAAALSGLVLLRPEAPLLVAGVAAILALNQ